MLKQTCRLLLLLLLAQIVSGQSFAKVVENPSYLTGTLNKPALFSQERYRQYPTGPFNHISDVPLVRVAHYTYVGELDNGKPVQTGLTAVVVMPSSVHNTSTYEHTIANTGFFAASEILGGNGELTGQAIVQDFGLLNSPILLTNTAQVGIVMQGVQQWMQQHYPDTWKLGMPIVGECWDGSFNTINHMPIKSEAVESVLSKATDYDQAVDRRIGRVGAGRGMKTFGVYGGIGSASRQFKLGDKTYTLGVLLNANHSRYDELSPEFKQMLESTLGESLQPISSSNKKVSFETSVPRTGSIVILIATDAPLLPHQLRWLSKRSIIGLTATGSKLRTSSGDFVLSLSTSTQVDLDSNAAQETEFLPIEELDRLITPLTEAIIESHFQAIVAANQSSRTNAAPRP